MECTLATDDTLFIVVTGPDVLKSYLASYIFAIPSHLFHNCGAFELQLASQVSSTGLNVLLQNGENRSMHPSSLHSAWHASYFVLRLVCSKLYCNMTMLLLMPFLL